MPSVTQEKKERHREGRRLPQGHTAGVKGAGCLELGERGEAWSEPDITMPDLETSFCWKPV